MTVGELISKLVALNMSEATVCVRIDLLGDDDPSEEDIAGVDVSEVDDDALVSLILVSE